MMKTLDNLAMKLLPIANAIGNQRHLQAIRNGLISILPLTIVGSFFTILLNLPIPGYSEMIAPYLAALDVPFRFTVGLMSLYAAFTIGSFLGNTYKLDKITSGFLSMLATLLMVMPVNLQEGVDVAGNAVAGGRYIPITPLGSQGLFGAIVAALISVEIYRFTKEKKLEIKMPEGVPPVVGESFAALLPTLLVILVFWVPRHFFNFNLNDLLSVAISPLKVFLTGNNIFGGIITQFMICLFWALGIHGHAVLGPIIRPFWDQAIIENAELFQNGTSAFQLPNIFTEQFYQWYAQMGGTGATLALVCLFLFSKSKYLKQLGKLSILPGIFNINEPVIFGTPIVMNPLLAIPFIIVPIVNTILVYIVTALGWMPKMMVKPPFSIPAPLGALITSNWNWVACVMVFVCFAVSLAIYYPFFKMFEKIQVEQEKQAEQEDSIAVTEGI
ncbi:PTS system, lactose/cellobiose family IIC component [Enterococcus haemoperoxidus ATCC BAA-382]|uniref:Permease IIC component n=2 Tax=Enterococcus haemoperoxidus TaxID=155618 RepID=R2QIP2_9ENTE|nr:PTS system, lactose/cellobiose family IIC component [Enterococcus haemoperoxidus ATCC BAA-382]EOT60457.1 PTS system, cellobiose-specific IIC component [Enterococcus haemoperoxidus ATCC BAA-382]